MTKRNTRGNLRWRRVPGNTVIFFFFFPMENIARKRKKTKNKKQNNRVVWLSKCKFFCSHHKTWSTARASSGFPTSYRRTSLIFFFQISSFSTADDSMNTTQCHFCIEDDFDLCMNHPEIQNCTSPATDSCFSATGRYKFTNGSTDVHVAVAQGCIACPSKIVFG